MIGVADLYMMPKGRQGKEQSSRRSHQSRSSPSNNIGDAVLSMSRLITPTGPLSPTLWLQLSFCQEHVLWEIPWIPHVVFGP